MKTTLFILAVLSTLLINAQDSTKVHNESNVEKFIVRSGLLVQQETWKIGEVDGRLYFELVKIVDVNSKVNLKGVRLSHIERSFGYMYTSNREDQEFIDEDELDDIISAFAFIRSPNLKRAENSNSTEVTYTSRGDVQVGCFTYDGSWIIFVKLDKGDQRTRVDFKSQKDFDALIGLFKKAKEMLAKI